MYLESYDYKKELPIIKLSEYKSNRHLEANKHIKNKEISFLITHETNITLIFFFFSWDIFSVRHFWKMTSKRKPLVSQDHIERSFGAKIIYFGIISDFDLYKWWWKWLLMIVNENDYYKRKTIV